MTYNTSRRRRFTAAQREALLDLHGHRCHWCRKAIDQGQPWDIEHMVPRELLPDARADADANLAPIHAHPAECHKIKTRRDRAMIDKSNRIQRSNGPVEDRRQSKHPIRSRPMAKSPRKIPSRPFPKRQA